MATVSSATSSTGTTAATNPAANIVSLLGGGSGIDIQGLAQKLVAAEKQPREAAINADISKTEARITGYGALKSALDELRTSFATLDDASDLASLTTSNSQPTAFSVTTGPKAEAGAYELEVTRPALAQRSVGTFADRTTRLNGSQAFTLSFTLGSDPSAVPTTIEVKTDTPGGIVSAINGSGIAGLKAQLVDTGSAIKVVVTGPEGAANTFSLTSSAAGASFATTQSPRDATLVLNGETLTRPSNTITDVLDGVTLKLYNATSGSARLDLTRDTSGITSKIEGLVTAYNQFQDSVKVLGDRASKVEVFGGALAGDTLLRNIESIVRRFITDPQETGNSQFVKAPRDAGLAIDRNGALKLDKDKLASALQLHFDEVVDMFTAGTDNKSVYSSAPVGAAGGAVRRITELLKSSDMLESQTKSATKQVDAYKEQLTQLEDKMKQLMDRYIQQFSVMDNLVGEATSTRSSIKSTFDAMNNSKNN